VLLKQYGDAQRKAKEARKAGELVPRAKRRNPQKSMRAMLSVLFNSGGSKLWSLLALAIVRTAISNRLSRVSGELFHACFRKQMPWFTRLMVEHVAITFASSGLEATRQRVITALALRWREQLTRSIHKGYFSNMAYYRLSHVDRRIGNPEQIVCEDVPKFVNQLADLAGEYVTGLTDSIYFSLRLVSYMGSPRYLLYMLGYIVGTGTLTTMASPPFGRIYKKSQDLEGSYRQLQTRLHSNSESVALLGGIGMEAGIINKAFKDLVRHTGGVQKLQWKYGMFQDFLLKYLGATFAVVLILGPYFGGHLQPDNSTRGRANMLSHMRYHTGVIISLFAGLGTIATAPQKLFKLSAYADRIKEMQEVIKEINDNAKRDAASAGSNGSHMAAADEIRFEDCTVVTPADATLVEGLTLTVKPGTNLLVTGPNGSGKSSLFRVLGGLWPLTRGRVCKPGGAASGLAKEIFYVPQRPYVALGTLREQIIYPLTEGEVPLTDLPEGKLRELLAMVDLEYLLERGGSAERTDWGAVLSLGEQQRLGMARLFFHKPTFAILDECTSGVTMDMEERFCARVREIGCTCVTISHRPALVAFHDLVLALDGEGGWGVHEGMRNKGGGGESAAPAGALARGGAAGTAGSKAKVRAADSVAVTSSFTQRQEEEESMKDHLGAVLGKAPAAASYPAPPPRRRAHGHEFGGARPNKWGVVLRAIEPLKTPQMLWVPLVVVTRTFLSDRIASLNGESVKFVLRQDRAAFVRLIWRSVVQSAANAVCAPSLKYLTDSLALSWRSRLTKRLCSHYLDGTNSYAVANLEGISDADQRLTRDIERLSKELADLVPNMVKPLVDILWFSSRAYLLTGSRGLAILYVYMFLGVGLLRAVTPNFGKLLGDEQALEGVFRFVHARLRTHAESIAFFGGGARESDNTEGEFQKLMKHSRVVVYRRWLFDIADQFLTKQLPHNVTWGMSMMYSMNHRGQYDSTKVQGELVHDLRYLASMVSWSFVAFGDVLGLNKRFAELGGGVGRIAELITALEATAAESKGAEKGGGGGTAAADTDSISFQGADVVTPSNHMLARALSLTIRPKANLLVTGPNGCGKSSIFRASSGLWPLLRGKINVPGGAGAAGGRRVFYVPQKPYMAVGSLREQITYPHTAEEAAKNKGGMSRLDEELSGLLAMVKLSYLVEREGGWQVTEKWEDRLSLGEQQRLGMARLFFHRPQFAVLDECTNATSVDIEHLLYQQAQDLGITIITVSQRPALVKYHTSELRVLDGDGDWELRKIVHPA